jgi:hypothetical protein
MAKRFQWLVLNYRNLWGMLLMVERRLVIVVKCWSRLEVRVPVVISLVKVHLVREAVKIIHICFGNIMNDNLLIN